MATSPADVRDLIAKRFARSLRSVDARREPLPSTLPALDAALAGGLARGELLWLHAPWGSGGISVASAWARSVASRGGSALVVDARAATLPHAWVRAGNAGAIWVVRPELEHTWLALDLALRAGGFDLVVAVDAPLARDAARVRRLVLERETRLLLVGEHPPLRTALCARVHVDHVQWSSAPHGDAPSSRSLRIVADAIVNPQKGPPLVEAHPACIQRVHPDRLRPRPRVADRSPSRHAKPR